MFKNKYPGKFIAIEGLDGSGASTQTARIADHFKTGKKSFWTTQEPTSSVIGGIIKSSLTGDWKMVNPYSLQLLFAADRANHLTKDIIPRLAKGLTVITDRYFLSSLAYGSLDINDDDWLYNINSQFILPDLTILLKVSPKVCLTRIKDNRQSLELFEQAEKLQKVWRAYELLSKKYPGIKVIDGEKPEKEVFEEIIREVSNL
ncbi:MAG TPA: dTMP kinase [bacterium]|nr:dTMP kinase [bacterium]HNZ73213.1 dTMP kinase [bacterium]HOH67097.1 dTMP kinase [bacterium]HPN81339.1 dTMP kinase [bacterium]HPW39607.1 dTMP kinase [bacterium]